MRKLIYAINMTSDGCLDHTKGNPTEELHDYFTRLMDDADLLVYGRKTYELMVPFWPDIARNPAGEPRAFIEFAKAFDSKEKLVFSRSLGNAEDRNTRIVHTNPRDEILKLKQEQGKNMLLGGVTLPSQLIAQNLVDEYYFVIHPVIAGAGTRLMEGIPLQEKLQLKLAESKIMESGCVANHYVKL